LAEVLSPAIEAMAGLERRPFLVDRFYVARLFEIC
jgi:hypothetical protein